MLNKKIYILYGLTVIIFLILFTKLIIVNQVQKNSFEALYDSKSSITVVNEMPRGEIFDKNGVLLATDEAHVNLMYIEVGIKNDEELWQLAQTIADVVTVTDDNVYVADLQTLWINEFPEQAEAKLSAKDNEEIKKQDEEEQASYREKIIRENITDEDIQMLYDKYGQETVYTMVKMNASNYSSEPVVVASDLTEAEQYSILNMKNEIGGFYLANDWTRVYTQGDTLSAFLGSVGTIQTEDWDYYEALGYSQNEEVGTSYTEQELETILHGEPQEVEYVFDEKGNIQDEVIVNEGRSGYDVKLTIDIELQKNVDQILDDNLKVKQTPDLNQIYAVVTEAETGEILVSSGRMFDPNDSNKTDIIDNSKGTFTDAFEVGSSVKPAVLLTAYDLGVWSRDQYVYDSPMYFQGTPPKASWINMGTINEQTAITRSSNVYFWNVALAIAGETYEPYGTLNIEEKDFEALRSGLAQFGLGVSTGIDFEYENIGDTGTSYLPGFYLDMAIGQYDTYTAMQLNQYISTIANDGNRMQMQYLDSVHQPAGFGEYGELVYEQESKILNKISMSAEDVQYVQQLLLGPTQNYQGSGSNFMGSSYNPAGKTGTAEMYCQTLYFECSSSYYYGTSFIGYSPADNPEIQVSVLIPYTYTDSTGRTVEADLVGEQIEDMYFNE